MINDRILATDKNVISRVSRIGNGHIAIEERVLPFAVREAKRFYRPLSVMSIFSNPEISVQSGRVCKMNEWNCFQMGNPMLLCLSDHISPAHCLSFHDPESSHFTLHSYSPEGGWTSASSDDRTPHEFTSEHGGVSRNEDDGVDTVLDFMMFWRERRAKSMAVVTRNAISFY
jgi:hypothetical protein